MPTDPNATQDPAPDPSEDTQADGSQDTAPDTQGSTVDWESRYKELQSRASKIERERDLLRQQSTPASQDDGYDEPDEEPAPPPTRQAAAPATDRLSRDSWALAEQVYGQPALDAYGRAARLLDRAQTPADYVAAFEAYHEARIGGAKPAAAAQAAQAPASQPRIESNRPDASPDLSVIDQKAEAAQAKGDLKGYFAAKLEKLGIA